MRQSSAQRRQVAGHVRRSCEPPSTSAARGGTKLRHTMPFCRAALDRLRKPNMKMHKTIRQRRRRRMPQGALRYSARLSRQTQEAKDAQHQSYGTQCVFAGRLSTDSGSWGDLRGQRVAVIIAHRAPQVKAKAILLRVSDRPRTQALKANKHMLYKGRR